VALRQRRCRGEEELWGVVQFGEGSRGVLYRAERGAEGARLRRWAAVLRWPPLMAVRLGGRPLQGEEGAETAPGLVRRTHPRPLEC
jgi:hypothetical protein